MILAKKAFKQRQLPKLNVAGSIPVSRSKSCLLNVNRTVHDLQ